MSLLDELRDRISGMQGGGPSGATPVARDTGTINRNLQAEADALGRQMADSPRLPNNTYQPPSFEQQSHRFRAPPPTPPAGTVFTGQDFGTPGGGGTPTAARSSPGLGARLGNAFNAVTANRAARSGGTSMLSRLGNLPIPGAVGVGLTAAGGVAAGNLLTNEDSQRESFFDLGGDLGGESVDDANAVTAGAGLVSDATFGLGGAGSRFAGAFDNPSVDPLSGEPLSGLDRVFGAVQAAVDPRQVRQDRSQAVGRDGAFVTPGAVPASQIPDDGFVRQVLDAFSGDPAVVANDPTIVSEVPPGGAVPPADGGPPPMGGGGTTPPSSGGRAGGLSELLPVAEGTSPVGEAPMNSLRTVDGRVLRPGTGGDVNTISPENFVRPSTGLSERLGDARLAAARRGDTAALQTPEERAASRAAVAEQIAGAQASARQQEIRAASRLLQTRGIDPDIRRNAEARLSQLNAEEDRGNALTIARTNADARRTPATDPNLSPSVIAERLRQEGADRRAADPTSELLTGFEPVQDVRGDVTGFQANNSQGIPIVVPASELQQFSSQYQALRQGGQIPVAMTFADFVSRIQAQAGQG